MQQNVAKHIKNLKTSIKCNASGISVTQGVWDPTQVGASKNRLKSSCSGLAVVLPARPLGASWGLCGASWGPLGDR